MKKKLLKVLSVMLAVVLTLTAAPLSGFVGLELPEWLDISLKAKATDTVSGNVVLYNGHAYQIIDSPMTWTQAKEYCENLGGHLATVTSQEEQNILNNLALKSSKINIWLGACIISNNTFEWVTGESFKYTNWDSGEPNNCDSYEYYLMMYSSSGKWQDEDNVGESGNYALSKFGFICEWENENAIKNLAQYSFKIVDAISNKPIIGCTMSVNDLTYNFSDDGTFTLLVNDVSEYLGKEMVFSSIGYESYFCYLTDFNMYEQNIVRLTGSLGAGIHIVNTAFGTETINGPTMEVLGKEITLFTVDIGLDFSNLAGLESLKHLDSYLDDVDNAIKANNIMVDESTKTIKVMLGVSDGYDVTNTGKWNEDYKDFKDYYKSFSSISGQERLNKYRKIRSKLKQSKNDMVFSADTTFCGYAEISYATGELVIKEGGIVATAEAGVSETVPIGTWFYATFALKGEIEGKLLFEKNDDSTYSMGTNMSLAVKPSLEAGAKLFSKKLASAGVGIDGEIKGIVELPANSLSDALTISLSAQAYIRLNLLCFEVKPTTNFPSLQLYPTVQYMTNFESGSSLVLNEGDFQSVDRSYRLNSTMMNFYSSATGGNVTSYRDYSVYPYMSPKLVSTDDGSILAIWLKDDGAKSDNNRTTLYYRVYKDGAWSKEQAVFETQVADFAPVIYKGNEKVHIIWQRATEVFSDEATMEDSLDKTELVYSYYENGAFTEPVTIVNNGKYLTNYTVVAEDDSVFISWVENSENDYTLAEGTNTIYSRQFTDGEWQAIVTEKEDVADISEVISCYVDATPTVVYTTYTDDDTPQCNLYIRDAEYSDAAYYGISYHNNILYVLVNDELSYYEEGAFVSTGLQNVGVDYKMLSDDNNEAVVYSVDDGFKNELYASYLVDGQYTTPVALTEYGSHVSCFDVDYYNGQVVLFAGLDNLDNDTDDFPYGTTDLVFESFGETTDLTISDAIYYDEDSIVEGGTAAFTTFITNQGTSTINSATLSLSDSQGVVNSVEITEAILPGETREVEIEFAIPDDYECSVLSFEVSTDNDCESTNNSAEITIGKADIVLTDYAVDNGKIIGKVSNVGFEDADDVKIQIDNFDTEYTSLSTISVGTIVGGETKEFEYELSAEYTSYINYTDYDEFDLEISTSTPEANYENNHCIIIGAPIRVESITLNYSEVDVRLEDTVALIATVEPVNAMNRNVIWISDSTDIATVDENGVVTTYARGTAIISAITEDGDIVASCTVNVYSDFEFEKINNTEIRIIGYTGSENNLVIPDTLEGLPVTAIDAEFTGCTFETVHLGSNITEITSSSFNGVNTLTEITVDSANTTYLSDDGVLFTLDGTTMLKYPQGKPDTDYLVAETITSIGEDALINVTNLENITVPYYVSNISSGSFEGCSNINVNCYENSPAHNYCVENSIPYTLIIHNENEHEFSITTYVNPTCVSVGYTKHTCWICGDSYTDTEIEATGHNYEAIVTAPTCTEGGYTTYTCSVCGDSYIADETLALGHTEADVVVENLVKETCLEDGSYDDVIYCSTCSVELERTTVVIPSLGGHTEGDWEITTAPDCIIAGERIIKCTVCDEILQTEEIPATGHDESWKVTVKPTCKRTGTKIKYCLICDRTISTESVDIVDCEAGDWLVTIQPSCKSVGTQVKQCIYCTTVLETEQIPMIEHSAGDWEIVAEATCTSVGEKVIKCANCKTILETKELPMTEHIAGDWEIATEATCISAGEKIVKCTYCDEPLETEGIPATGVHNINDWQITTEPTTEIVGESVKKCTVCNTVFESKEIPILTDTSGFCGNDLLWNYDTETKTLTITGTGAMFDYTATTRPWEAFEDDMTTVILSDDVTYIGRLAFYHSSTLTTVDMGGVTTIGATAFGLCTTLTNIEIGSNVATINIGAFNGCTALESIIIPESLTTINNTVFNNCKALTDVYYAGLPEQWNSITIGANNTYLTDATFHYHYGQPHSHEEWNITREATCTEVGSKTRSCLDCGKTEIVEISAIGHTACDWIVTVEVTCLSDGEKIKKCTVCEELLETEIIGATGHNYEAVITESSCLEGGFTTYTCSYCADVYVSDETESLGGHSVVDGVCKQCGEIIQSVIFDLKWDKEEYLPGETAQLSIYMNVADSLSLGTGAITIGLDSNTILQDDNLVADTKASITTSELFDSFWKTPPTMAWQSATIANKISNSNTQEENETYDQYLKILFARNTSGSHENASNSKNGIYGYEFNSEEPIMTLSFVVASDVTQGVNLNAAITSGSVLCTPIQIYFKYYVDPGNATTTKNLDATTIDISQACATASISDGTSECVHENITETEDIILLPTCVTDGEKTISVICDDCGEAVSVISEMIPTTGHDFNAVVTVPTCISQGYTTYTCSCGECYISDYIDSTEHCYDNGICLNCGGYRPCVFVENGMYVEGLYYNLNTLDWVKNNVGIGNISIEIYNINNEKVSDDDLVGTGATVYIYDSTTNELLDTYTVVLYGDVNGDGIINDTDKEIITYVATCTGTIDNKWCLMAADTNHDGAVDSFDVIETQLQTLDMHNIEQINNSAYIKEDSEDEEVA